MPAIRWPRPAAPLGALLLLLGAACDETDAVAVRIRVEPDLSGVVATSGVRVPDPAAPMEHVSSGVTWTGRLNLVCALGEFESLSELAIEDVTFEAGSAGATLSYVEVTLPRGPQARWPRALVPLSEDERRDAARTLDPAGRLRAVGDTVKLELELPERVIGHGLSSRTLGAKEKADGTKATLVVPLASALEPGEPLIWNVTWRRPE
jgi:hypothetical protein